MKLPMGSLLEGFVSQLLADYLSNYIKGIHPEQFRLGVWNGVAQLENMELRIEAFDYLQLPIAIKKGVVGNLKIQVPWKKLGWEPILIVLQDVHLCACPREEFEWKSEALEARSLAAKKAKLAAAELSKLSDQISSHVSGTGYHSSQSFLSYLSTKILDNMQLTIENVHFRYIDEKTDPEMRFSVGIIFSCVTMTTDHISFGNTSGKSKLNIVNKLVNLRGFSVYWNSNENHSEDSGNHEFTASELYQQKWTYLIHPFDATVKLAVNKNAPLDGTTPQYSMVLQMDNLSFTLEDRQVHQMLLLWDALYICKMREKYGRHRPAIGQHGYNRREKGWQKVWWHYAFESVLVDVREKLRRSSWSYLGWRMEMRRSYIALYKDKLDCLRRNKPAAVENLCKLEQLEKELELEEILSFRSMAECNLKDQDVGNILEEENSIEQVEIKPTEAKLDDQSSTKQRSWLNFLSLGMLGAAGSTAASEQFAGVLPDEIIEDIYEAVRYDPSGMKGQGDLPKGSCRVSVTSYVNAASITLRCLYCQESIASLHMKPIETRIKMWWHSTDYFVAIKELKVVDLSVKKSAYPIIMGNAGLILPYFWEGQHKQTTDGAVSVINSVGSHMDVSFQSKVCSEEPLVTLEVNVLSDLNVAVMVAVKPVEFVYSSTLVERMKNFFDRPSSLRTLKDLIFSSLDQLQSPKIRLQSKAELALALGKQMSFNMKVQRPVIIYPQNMLSLDSSQLIVVMDLLQVSSVELESYHVSNEASARRIQLWITNELKQSGIFQQQTDAINEWFHKTIYPAVYNQFEFQLQRVQVILSSGAHDWITDSKGTRDINEDHLAKDFDACGTLEICSLPDEPTLTPFKLHGVLPHLEVLLSAKKWRLLDLLFSSGSDDAFGTVDLSTDMDEGSNGMDISSQECCTAPKFELVLLCEKLSVNLDMEDSTNLQLIGETASLMYIYSQHQKKLTFMVNTVHMNKILSDSNAILSLHSLSQLTVSALFIPTTVWKLEWVASNVTAALCRNGQPLIADITLLILKELHLSGSWKNGSLDSLKCKVAQVNLKFHVYHLDAKKFSHCALCEECNFWFIHVDELQQCDDLLTCKQSENQFGLDIDLVQLRGCKQIYVSMPYAKMNLYLSSWERCLQAMSMFMLENDIDSQRTPIEVSEASKSTMSHLRVPVDSFVEDNRLHEYSVILQSSAICLVVFFPECGQVNTEWNTLETIKTAAENIGRESDHDLDCDSIGKHIMLKTVFCLEKLCYSDSLCDAEASVSKCEMNLIERTVENFHCIPLLRVTDLQISARTDLISTVKHLVGTRITFTVRKLDLWCSCSVIQFLRLFKLENLRTTHSRMEIDSIAITGSVQLGSILISDGTWNYNAPIFDIRMKDLNCQTSWSPNNTESCISMRLEVDYHDMEKVSWESFLEPWNFSFCMKTDSHINELSFSSGSQLNLNLTGPLLQASSRTMELFSDIPRKIGFTSHPLQSNSYTGYAPYWLQNDTGVPIRYWLVGALKHEDSDGVIDEYGISSVIPAGCSVPIYIEETVEQMFLKGRASVSSDRLSDKKIFSGCHRLIRIQIEGTSNVSSPMSMDLVGAHIFYVTFSHSSKSNSENLISKGISLEGKLGENGDIDGSASAFSTPVVFEVFCHFYSKVVRIYSTVSLVNASSVPMEVRFDIPFGVLPKVMEPILPGNVAPLPVHLAETGQIRWRPMGNTHVWSEPQSLLNILTWPKQASLRSFVSYPVNPNDAIFRCCIMVQEMTISEQKHKLQTHSMELNSMDSQQSIARKISSFHVHSPAPLLRELIFQAPLLFKNCLPLPLTVSVKNSTGLHLEFSVLEGESKFILEVNPGQDLVLMLTVPGFLPHHWTVQTANIPPEHQSLSDKSNLIFVEKLEFLPDSQSGYTVYVEGESLFNSLSGARVLTVSVPFWIYNCTGVNLGLIDEDLGLLTSCIQEQLVPCISSPGTGDRNLVDKCYGLQTILQKRHWPSSGVYMKEKLCQTSSKKSVEGSEGIISCKLECIDEDRTSPELSNLKPHMYSPYKSEEIGDKRLKARVAISCSRKGLFPVEASETRWSRPFSLNPPGVVTTVVIPSSESEGGLILSVISAGTLGASAGKTRTITFQPRFVLANICSHDLCYRQQGCDASYHLLKGSQAQLLWTDMNRPLLVHVRFDEYGWDWSGTFAPDLLGDTQLKLRNLITGATRVLRTEVQNASFLDSGFNGISSSDSSLGTYMILLSDDDTGFMPYRIDNFSVERLRFYQLKCPDFESVLLPYSSSAYAWDEPLGPHFLVLEIPGEGCIGTFDLDEIREHPRIHLPLTHQKPEREFLITVHAEGPTRVLTFQDVNLHPLEGGFSKEGSSRGSSQHDSDIVYRHSLSVNFDSIGISIIDSSPQEILFMCAKGITLQLLQGSQEHNLNMNISYIQIDNQLHHSQYPVMVVVGNSYYSCESPVVDRAEHISSIPEDSANVPFQSTAFSLNISKWRHLVRSVDCYQKVDVRLSPAQVQVDEQIVCCLLDFIAVLNGSGNQMLHLDSNSDLGYAGFQKSLKIQNYEIVVDASNSQLHLIKRLKWKELYSSWPAPQALKFLQSQNPKHLQGGRKLYIENLYIAPIEVIVSFSSTSWTHGSRINTQSTSLLWQNGGLLQRGLIALIDIEGAPIQLRQLSLSHPLARWDAIQGIIVRHYSRQLLHEIYKVLGSAGFLGNPMGFIRSLGSGVRDFVSVPAKSFVESPKQLVGGFALGTQSLVSNTIFAVSNAATLMSRVARKSVTAFALGHEREREFQDYGVISEVLEGLTGLLQSPVTGAEQHGIPGILSGIAVGAVGVVARPIASILELAGRTAQSIRSWSQPIQQAKRIRPPRYLSRDIPLLPYSWEEAIGHAVLRDAVGSRLENEVYVSCSPLVEPGKFILVTGRLLLIVRSTLYNHSIRVGSEWIVDKEIAIQDVLHFERTGQVLHILRGSPRYPPRSKASREKEMAAASRPLVIEYLELRRSTDAEEVAAYLTEKLCKV